MRAGECGVCVEVSHECVVPTWEAMANTVLVMADTMVTRIVATMA